MNSLIQKIDYKTYKKPTDFLKLELGENMIRIVSDGYLLKKHRFKTAKSYVSRPCTGAGCQYCEKGNEFKVRYMWIGLNRKDGSVGVLDAGSMIGDEICKLALKANLLENDLLITRKGEKLGTTYTLRFAPDPKPITEEERGAIRLNLPYLKNKYFTRDQK